MNANISILLEELSQYARQSGNSQAFSVLEFLWEQYANEHPICDECIKECEAALAPVFESLPWDASNELFVMVYDLCLAYQRAAFLHGLHTGFHLSKELQ